MSSVTDAERESPAWKLFNHRFLCSIPSSWAVSEHDVRRFGTVTSGNKKYDAEIASLPANVYRSAAEMADLHSKGVSITLHNPQDSVKIRDLIVAHIEAWAKRLNNDYAIVAPSDDEKRDLTELMDDITKLETFLLTVDPVAKRQGLPTSHGIILNKFRQFGFNVDQMAKVGQAPASRFETQPTHELEAKLTNRALDAVRRWKL